MKNAYDVMVATLCTLLDSGNESDVEIVARAVRPIADDDDADVVLGLSERESYSSKEFWVPCDDEAALAREEFVSKRKAHRYCRTCKGKLGWWDSAAGIDAYGTTTGDKPVIFDRAVIADSERSAGGWSDVEPEYLPSHYSAAKPGYGKSTYRRFRAMWDNVTACVTDNELWNLWRDFTSTERRFAERMDALQAKLDRYADLEIEWARYATRHTYFNVANGSNIAVPEATMRKLAEAARKVRAELASAQDEYDAWLNYRERSALYQLFYARDIKGVKARRNAARYAR